MWASLRRYEGVDFVGQCYAACPPLVHVETNSTYYLWDVLTTAFTGNSTLVKVKTVSSIVYTETPRQGRTEISEEGRPVDVVYDVTAEAFFTYITDLMKKAVAK
jgi:purine nucleosidase